METTQEAVDRLAALVDIPDYLMRAGYRGAKYRSCDCPVAMYLRDKTGESHVVCKEMIANLGSLEAISVPLPIQDFIDRYDRGDFPELIEIERS